MNAQNMRALRLYVARHRLNRDLVVPVGKNGISNRGYILRLTPYALILETNTDFKILDPPDDLLECYKLVDTILIKASLGIPV
jgi:hypothetical protein